VVRLTWAKAGDARSETARARAKSRIKLDTTEPVYRIRASPPIGERRHAMCLKAAAHIGARGW
jgi:hypothetical protein